MTDAGYALDRKDGLTARERAVRDAITAPRTFAEVGARLGMSRQRVGQIAQALVTKGVLVKADDGAYRLAGEGDE